MKIVRIALPLIVVLLAACSDADPTGPGRAPSPDAPLYDGGGTMGSGT